MQLSSVTIRPRHRFMVPVPCSAIGYTDEIRKAAEAGTAYPFLISAGALIWNAPLGAAGSLVGIQLRFTANMKASKALISALKYGARLVAAPAVVMKDAGRAEIPVDEMWPVYLISVTDGFTSKSDNNSTHGLLTKLSGLPPTTNPDSVAGATLIAYTPQANQPFPGKPYIHTERGGWKLPYKTVELAPRVISQSMLGSGVVRDCFPPVCPALDALDNVDDAVDEIMKGYGYEFKRPVKRKRRGINHG